MQLEEVYEVVERFCKTFSVPENDCAIILNYVKTGEDYNRVRRECIDISTDVSTFARVCKPVFAEVGNMRRETEVFKAAYRFMEYMFVHVDYKMPNNYYNSGIFYFKNFCSLGLSVKETLMAMTVKSRENEPNFIFYYSYSSFEDIKDETADELCSVIFSYTPEDICYSRRWHAFLRRLQAAVIKYRLLGNLGEINKINDLIDSINEIREKISLARKVPPAPSAYSYENSDWLYNMKDLISNCYRSFLWLLSDDKNWENKLLQYKDSVFTYSEQLDAFACEDGWRSTFIEAFTALIKDDEIRAKLFSKESMSVANGYGLSSKLEEAYTTYHDTYLLFNGMCFSPNKKVNAFCNAELDKRKKELGEEFKRFAAEQELPKSNAELISALFEKWKDEDAVFEGFASLAEVEAYAKTQKLNSARLLSKFDFSLTVYGRDKVTPVSENVLKVFVDKYFSMKDIYRNKMCDGMAAHFDKTSFRQFLDNVYAVWEASDFDNKLKAAVVPYCFYASNENLSKFKKRCIALCDAGRHALTAYIIRVLALNGGKYALMLVDGIANKFPYPKAKQVAKNAMAEAAEKYNIPVEVLADIIIPSCGFGADGTRAFGKDLTLTLMPGGEVRITRGEKVIKSLPSDTDAETKKEFSELKKDVKTVAKLQTVRLERALMFGRCWNYKSFRSCYMQNPVIRNLTTNLIWGKYTEDGSLIEAFRFGADCRAENADYDEVTFSDGDIIALVHVCDLTEEQLSAWRTYVDDNEIKQPFLQISAKVLFPENVNPKTQFIEFEKYPFNFSHLQRVVRKYDMEKTETIDGGGFDGFYLFDSESGLGIELLMEGLYFGCDYDEGKNLSVGFYCKKDEDRNEYINPCEFPTRIVSSVLSSLAAVMPELQLSQTGKTVKKNFVPYVAEGVDFDEEEEAPAPESAPAPTPAAEQSAEAEAQEEAEAEVKVQTEAAAEIAVAQDSDKVEKAAPAVNMHNSAPSADGADMSDYLEFSEGTSNKFWKIEVRGNSHTVIYGRIGAEGREVVKTFSSADEAMSDAQKLVASKIKKGYSRK